MTECDTDTQVCTHTEEIKTKAGSRVNKTKRQVVSFPKRHVSNKIGSLAVEEE